MHVLLSSQGAELLDPRLDVVSSHPLTAGNRVEVDVVDHGSVRLNHSVGHVDAKGPLRLQDGEPELALEAHLVLR